MIAIERNGIAYRKSTRSGAGNDCAYVRADLRAVWDSKADRELSAPMADLVEWLRKPR